MSVVFLKSRELYYEGELLYDKFDTCDNDIEKSEIDHQIDELAKKNLTKGFDNLFTCDAGLGEDEVIEIDNKEVFLQFINEHNLEFSFMVDGKVLNKEQGKQFILYKIDKFWQQNPNGIIIID